MEENKIKNQKSKIKNPNYLPWLILREIPSLGNIRYKTLIEHFHSPEAVLNASEAELKGMCRSSVEGQGIGSLPHSRASLPTLAIIKNILNHKAFIDKAKKELEHILQYNIRLLTLSDRQYPVLLKEIPDPPPILSYYGSLDSESPCLAIVGSRKATSYGLKAAENLACNLASQGFQVVSGMARGIDSMAHKGALSAQGKTIAVLGSGLKKIYPRENEALFHAIAQKGCVFSEFKSFAAPMPAHFPIRNRIIAGLCCGTIVVEAAKRSGSLITARLAGEYNREIFAVPGSIKSSTSEGSHALLKQGAKLVENEKDIFDELQQFVHVSNFQADKSVVNEQKSKSSIYTGKAYRIVDFLDPYPIHIDILIEKSGMESSSLSSELFDLELEGRVVRHPGNFYSIA